MKNNTKLIMETWRRFLKEDVLDDEPSEGYLDDEYNPEGFNPDDEGLDNPIDGEPPFEDSLPASDSDLSSMDDLHKFDPDRSSPTDYDDDMSMAGDDMEYTEEDAKTPPADYDDIFDLRYGSRFGSNDELDDNPFGEDDGPY